MRKIIFVTGLHGNERLPVLALAAIGQKQIVANPDAVAKNVRFVEKDMNASFGNGGETYEEKRARAILKIIDKEGLVIDLHTFSMKSKPFVIIVDLQMLNFAKSLGFENVVYMKFNIKSGHALINHRNGVSVELGSHTDPKSFERAIELVGEIKKKNNRVLKTKIYEVYAKIDRSGKYINFREHKDGFIPILAGGKSYDFFGLKARIIKEI